MIKQTISLLEHISQVNISYTGLIQADTNVTFTVIIYFWINYSNKHPSLINIENITYIYIYTYYNNLHIYIYINIYTYYNNYMYI